MRRLSRRGFIASSGAALGAPPLIRSIDALAQAANPVFRHGVASGDPLSDRVILWTRVTPKSPTGAQRVSWVLARDPKLAQVVSRGELETGAARDFTVKVDAMGLQPGTAYYYRFESMGERSAIGRTRTLPAAGVSQVRLGVVSCSNLPQATSTPTPAWRTVPISMRSCTSATICMSTPTRSTAMAPASAGFLRRTERSSRWATIATDTLNTKAILTPRRCIASTRSPSPGTITSSPTTPGAAARKTMTRAKASGRCGAPRRCRRITSGCRFARTRRRCRTASIARSASATWGRCSCSTRRLIGRDQEAPREDTTTIELPDRQLLGAEQEGWLAEQLVTSVRNQSHWSLLGQQVMFAPQTPSGVRASNPDSWDGYRAARGRVFDMLERAKVDNLCVLTGDVHSCWAYDLARSPFGGYDKATGKGSLGVEFAGTSVTSPSSLGSGPDGEKQLAEAATSSST